MASVAFVIPNFNTMPHMKNVFVLLPLTALLSLSACKKCQVCHAKDQDNIVRYTYPEVCGSKKDLSAYADQCITQYGSFDYKCECIEQ
ncbi:MAG: hypothetical protein Kow0075_08320 [Salibacteraceae bacterium]